MVVWTLHLNELQARVRNGDVGAARELCRRLEPIIASMVRRALCFPGEKSWLANVVQAEIRRMSLAGCEKWMAEDRRLVARIVARIRSTLIVRLRIGFDPAPASPDTIRDWSVWTFS